MTNQHPITPPPELVEQWRAAASNVPASLSTDPGGRRDYIDFIATQAARWGADTELDACCEWMRNAPFGFSLSTSSYQLRNSRRPKPPSLKEQALLAIDTAVADGRLSPDVSNVVRRALEALDG